MGSGGNNRLLIAGVCSILLVAAMRGADPGRADAASPELSEAGPTQRVVTANAAAYAEDYAHFGSLLGAFREGDDTQLEALRLAAQRLASEHQRADAPRVVEYYAELQASERRLGLDASDEVNEFITRAEGRSGANWRTERPELLRDLEAFAARVLAQPDFTAAANALALASEIRTDSSRFHVEEEQQQIERAQRDALEALAVFERAGMQTPKLRPMLQLGRLMVLQSRDAEARQQFQTGLELARYCHQTGFETKNLVALIRLARNAGDAPELELRLEQLARVCTPGESWELAREHAMLWIHKDEPERAAQFLLRHRPRQTEELDVWRRVLATARVRMGEFAAARELIRRLDSTRGPDGEDLTLLHATLDLAEGNTIAVLERLQGAGGELTVLSERGQSRAAVLVGEAHLREGHAALALDFLRRARILAEGWEVRMEEAHPSANSGATVLGEWLGLHAVVLEARALCDLGRELEAAVLIERAHAWRWRHAARADQLSSAPGSETLDVRDLQAWAARHELGLVTWILGADVGLAIHISAEGQAVSSEIDISRRSMGRAVRRFRSALLHGTPERQTQLGTELREALLPASVEDALADHPDPQSELLLLAHGELERLPFEALPRAGGVLDQQVCLLTLPELPTRRPGTLTEPTLNWTLLGDPVDESGLLRLPAAGNELRQLEGLRPAAQSFAQENLTRDALLAALQSGGPLHIATHLNRTSDCASPRFAGIALELSAGEVLCAQTLAGLASHSPLVVLSACETADGRHLDARGLQGIARAFLDAGVRNLLVTLWPIRDDVAVQFSEHFHRALLSGKSPARAAQLARRSLAQSGVAAADWASYRALGRD